MALSKKSNNNSNSAYNKPLYANKSGTVPIALIGGLSLGGLAATSKAMDLAKRAKDLRDRANWTNMKKKYYDEENARLQRQRESDDLLNKDKADAIRRAKWQREEQREADEAMLRSRGAAYKKAREDEEAARNKSLFSKAGDAIYDAWNNSGYLGKGAMIGAAAAAAGAIGYGSYKLVKHIVNKFKNKVANSKDSPQAKRAAVNSMINEINTKISKAKSSEEKHELMKSKAELQETLAKIK